MRDADPQTEPRLEKANSGPKVATGHVDPCLVFLETTLPGEIPLLGVCWAAWSRQSCKPGESTCLTIDNVRVFKFERTMLPDPAKAARLKGQPSWHFHDYLHVSLLLTSQGDAFSVQTLTGDPFLSHLQSPPPLAFKGSIRFLDRKTENHLRTCLAEESSASLAKDLLRLAEVHWPSIAEALASLERTEPAQDRSDRASIIQQVALIKQKYAERAQRRSSLQEALLQPNQDVLSYFMGDGLYEIEEYKRATGELQKALKHPGVRYEALNKLGLCYMKQGMFDFAVKQLELAEIELLAMDDLKKEIVYNLGLAYEASNQPQKAFEQWKKIYEVDMCYRDVAERVEAAYD